MSLQTCSEVLKQEPVRAVWPHQPHSSCYYLLLITSHRYLNIYVGVKYVGFIETGSPNVAWLVSCPCCLSLLSVELQTCTTTPGLDTLMPWFPTIPRMIYGRNFQLTRLFYMEVSACVPQLAAGMLTKKHFISAHTSTTGN